ncbi:MAG: sugar phosphate isomerase/epimerase [Nitrososphaeria archaeon]|nr:sugar phosphate isomerase/epimerase [Nitrososphaeria archaeon]
MPKYGFVISEDIGYIVKNIFKDINDKKNFEEGLETLKKIGYEGAVIPLMFNIGILVKQVNEIFKKHGIEIAGLSTDHYTTHLGYSFISTNPAVRGRTLDVIMSGLLIARELSSPLIIGKIIGKGIKDEKTEVWLQASLKILDKRAKDFGVKVLIEPLNSYETSFLNSLSEVYSLIKKLSLENTGILVNSYNMDIEELRIDEAIEYTKERIWYTKFSDTKRMPLGYGHIDFGKIVKALKKIGYNGWYIIECLPVPSAEDAAKTSLNYLKRIL